ncbi:SET domain-containing protein [Auriscalpium vulgare]|uniref:SET domain-containing protein n=1 Tax=Auriscalpium vulgare TaxID=40419 RepID=A0ACB8RF35_9AGAM|nr:SET domain-containing protein [Auriscalpium vulgare]
MPFIHICDVWLSSFSDPSRLHDVKSPCPAITMRRGFLINKESRRTKGPNAPTEHTSPPITAARRPPPTIPIPTRLILLAGMEDSPDAINQAIRGKAVTLSLGLFDIADVNGGLHTITTGLFTTENEQPPHLRSWKPFNCSRRYEIRDTKRAGKSMFSLDVHEPGDVIICEPPLVITSIALMTGSGGDSLMPESTVRARTFATMPPKTRRLFFALHRGPHAAQSPETAITKTNAFRINRIPGCIGPCSGIFNDISRINHSCMPNAMYYWIPESLTGEVRALRRIAPGEEITISYLELSASYEERREDLRERYGFACTCTSCSLPLEERFVDDSIREETGLFAGVDVHVSSANALRITKSVLCFARRVKHAGLSDIPVIWERIAATLVATACTLGDRARAVQWALVAAHAARIQIRSDAGWEAVAAAPEKTELWMTGHRDEHADDAVADKRMVWKGPQFFSSRGTPHDVNLLSSYGQRS